jgi:putative ferrous iron transport protein C
MILSDLRDYLSTRRQATLQDMAHRFDSDPETIRAMLSRFEQKGQIRPLSSNITCGTCTKCDPTVVEIYEWVGR